MEKLPKEMIFLITSFLSIRDKLNLACNNKKLHTTISENTLYTKFVFKDRLKLDQALNLHQKTNFRKQVRHLCIEEDMVHDLRLLSALPTVFSGVQFLEIKSEYRYYLVEDINIHALDMAENWKNWRNVESLWVLIAL